MRNIKLILEYDGSRFAGFQRQKAHRTVQNELESALKKLFRRKVGVAASGRTDSGVHAEAQVVNFKTDSEIPLFKIQQALNSYLPEDLAVTEIKEVPTSFHSQFDAKWKIYEYRVLNRKSRSPLERFRTYHVPYLMDLARMRRAARLLVGTYDFRAFEASGGRRKSAVRTIRKFTVEKHGEFIYFTVESNGFLYKMVRSMVGTLLEVGLGRLSLSDFKRILASKDRTLVGPTVPPQGLTLKRVTY